MSSDWWYRAQSIETCQSPSPPHPDTYVLCPGRHVHLASATIRTLSPYPWPRLWPVDPLPLLHTSWSWSSTLSHGPRHLFSAPSHGQDKDASRISGFLARRKHVADDCIESWRKWHCPAKPRPQHGLAWRNNTSRGFHRSRILAFPFSPSAVSFPRCEPSGIGYTRRLSRFPSGPRLEYMNLYADINNKPVRTWNTQSTRHHQKTQRHPSLCWHRRSLHFMPIFRPGFVF